MTTHVAILANDQNYNGTQVGKDVKDWLNANVGKQARDMTELIWTSKMWL